MEACVEVLESSRPSGAASIIFDYWSDGQGHTLGGVRLDLEDVQRPMGVELRRRVTHCLVRATSMPPTMASAALFGA
jgi:hypothetical protein